MKLKIICGQIEVTPGRPNINFAKIMDTITYARSQKADLLLLPELCVPGYFIGDLWEQSSYLDDCEYYNTEIIKASKDICILFGSVAREPGKHNADGRVRKYNAAFAAQNGKLVGGCCGHNYIIKTNLPNYRAFEGSRHFCGLAQVCMEEDVAVAAALQPIAVDIRGQQLKIGLMLCEDGWTESYNFNVPELLAENGAQLLCNLSCSPYTLGKNDKRHMFFATQAKQTELPLVYCNNVGLQNNGKNLFTYNGESSIYDKSGRLIAAAKMYTEELLECELETDAVAAGLSYAPTASTCEAECIYKALRYGTEKFLSQFGIKKMTIGLSGGVDSAITAAMYTLILGSENVLLLNLPSQFNSAATQNLARQLAENLGANYAVIPIDRSYEHTVEQISSTEITHLQSGKTFNLQLNQLIKENIQARDRGARVLAAAGAAFGGAFSCNANKAETAVGYATFYGDICGALAMLGDLWKHQVYSLGRYLNEQIFEKEVIPAAIFTIRPSAELSDEQTVGKGGDPLIYPYHDYLLRSFIENWQKTTPADILRWYKDGSLAQRLGCSQKVIDNSFPTPAAFITDLERWWRLFAGFSVAKRIQSPPIISISQRAFGSDHQEAQLSPYFSREFYILKEELLNSKK